MASAEDSVADSQAVVASVADSLAVAADSPAAALADSAVDALVALSLAVATPVEAAVSSAASCSGISWAAPAVAGAIPHPNKIPTSQAQSGPILAPLHLSGAPPVASPPSSSSSAP